MPLDVAVDAQRRIDIVMKNITDDLWAKKKLANFQQGLEIAIVLNASETDDSCWSYARTTITDHYQRVSLTAESASTQVTNSLADGTAAEVEPSRYEFCLPYVPAVLANPAGPHS